MIALISNWRLLGCVGAAAMLAALASLWRLEAGHARKLAEQLSDAKAAGQVQAAAAAAARAAGVVIGAGAARDQGTSATHEENRDAITATPGAAQAIDPALNDAGRIGLCRYRAYDGDAQCLELRGADPAGRPGAGQGGSAAGPRRDGRGAVDGAGWTDGAAGPGEWTSGGR
jgi:hypothetical protein